MEDLSISQIREKLFAIFEEEPVRKVILFGSYAKGSSSSNSDIDLVIDSNGKLYGFRFFGILERIKEVLGKDIDLFEMSEIENGSEIEKVIKQEGVVLYDRKN